jgi:hypothetical protein
VCERCDDRVHCGLDLGFSRAHKPPLNSRHGTDLLGGRVKVDRGENSMDERTETPPARALGIRTRHDLNVNLVVPNRTA